MKTLRRVAVAVVVLALLFVIPALVWYFTSRVVVADLEATVESDLLVAPTVSPETLRQVSDRLSRLRLDAAHPAVSASIAMHGVILWSEAQGHADIAPRRPATLETRFPIGSVSKTLTAAGALRLVERGRLDLDAEIHTYVPDFPGKAHPITTRQLLSHQAGIRHYRLTWDPPLFSEAAWNVQYGSVRESLVLFADEPLAFVPDASFQYSTYGYTLVSAAMESAAGEPFLDYMRTALFEPLAMRRTQADDSTGERPDRATDYIAGFGGSVLPAPPTNSSNKWAGGGFVSTPRDLVRFGSALLDGRIVNVANRELMFEPRRTSDGEVNEQSYGLGCRVGRMTFPPDSDRFVRIVHHGGTSIGAQCALFLVPDSNVVVAISANSHTGGSGELIQAAAFMARVFMAAPELQVPPPPG